MPYGCKYSISLTANDGSSIPITLQISRKCAGKIVDLLKKDQEKVALEKINRWVETEGADSMLDHFF